MAASLTQEHRRILEEESGIAPQIVGDRRYQSVGVGEEKVLKDLGFGRDYCRPPGMLIPLFDVSGDLATWQFRFDTPLAKGDKKLRYTGPYGVRPILDVPPAARAGLIDPTVELIITEGAKKADAAVSRGICCVDLAGVWNFRYKKDGVPTVIPEFDRVPLKGRGVVVCYDSDVMQNAKVRSALDALTKVLRDRGARVEYAILEAPEGGKVGLDDYLATGGRFEDVKRVKPEDLPRREGSTGRKEEKRSKPEGGQAAEIERAALAAGLELWCDESREPHASVPIDGRVENLRVKGRQMEGFLYATYKQAQGAAPSTQALKEAVERLTLEAVHAGPERPTALRAWSVECVSYLDLADEERRVVKVDAAGWRVLGPGDEIPVRFLRAATMEPLPVPEPGGSLDRLRDFLSVTDAGFAFVRAWLLGCFLSRGAIPILLATGEQGSGKSSGCRFVRSLVDPNRSPLRTLPGDKRSLAAAVRSSMVLAFDNVSGVRAEMSDLLCSVSTGLGIDMYKLYADAEEFLVPARAATILNGIGDIASRPDLLDRTLPVGFIRIEGAGRRRPEAELDREYEERRPAMLGGLLDALSAGLAALPSLSIDSELPRLADLGRLVTASEPEGERGTFLRLLASCRKEQSADVVEGDVLAAALDELVRERGYLRESASTILCELNRRRDSPSRPPDWPRSPRELTSRLGRLAPALRQNGIAVDQGQRTARQRSWVLRVVDDGPTRPPGDGPGDTDPSESGRASAVEPSPASLMPTPDDGGDVRDAGRKGFVQDGGGLREGETFL